MSKLYGVVAVFLLIGLSGCNNPFEKKWHEDCNSELMKKGLYDGFKFYVERQNSNYKLKDMELVSKITMIETEPLKCSVRVSYNLSLGTFRYQTGTATLIRIHKNINNETNTINADFILVDMNSKIHSLFNSTY